MPDRPSPHTVGTGILAALVGFASSFAVILQGLTASGASADQAASGLMALSISMGICGVLVSLRSKIPVSIAWSTPGAALLASSSAPRGGFAVAVGAFLVCGMLITLAGVWKPLARSVSAIPSSLASAMLAGVLLSLCLAPVRAVAEQPIAALSIILVWFVVGRFNRIYAVPAAVVATVIAIFCIATPSTGLHGGWLGRPVWVMPQFSGAAIVGVAIPLFIVTMASQNVPGLAVLRVHGYTPDAAPLFRTTGIFSLLAVPMGGHAVNLAAITAAMCAGPDAHADPARRYWAAAAAGLTYIVLGIFAGAAGSLLILAPPVLIETVAGLALLGAFGASLTNALADPLDREAALITFLVAAAGISLGGISGAFWGLLAGGAVRFASHRRAPLA